MLRTGFGFAGSGELVRRVHRNASSLAFEEHGWRGMDAGEREERVHRYLEADRRRGFELGAQRPLPMRVAPFRMGRAEYRFAWTSHHALLDGRSRLRVLTERFLAYEAYCRGEEPRCQRARPYRDYVEWPGTHEATEAERFWRRALRGLAAPTPLVVDAATPRSTSPD